MKRHILISLIPIVVMSIQASAQGDLLIAPTRAVFNGNSQREELNIVNIGKDTATYSISFIHYNMKEDGRYIIIDKPDSGQMFADTYLRFFPRKVTLAPRESQVIMLQCNRKPDMVAGEYRSHLYFRSEKDYKPLGSKNYDTTTINVQLIPIYGISIPVMIRSGSVNVNAAITNLKLKMIQDSIPYLKFTINRTGNISIFGDIHIDYYPIKGKPYQLGKVTNAGVLSNINKRNFSMQLMHTPGLDFKNGKLIVHYTSPEESKYVVYAEGELNLNR